MYNLRFTEFEVLVANLEKKKKKESPELGPLVRSISECEGSDLQLLDVHGQDVR